MTRIALLTAALPLLVACQSEEAWDPNPMDNNPQSADMDMVRAAEPSLATLDNRFQQLDRTLLRQQRRPFVEHVNAMAETLDDRLDRIEQRMPGDAPAELESQLTQLEQRLDEVTDEVTELPVGSWTEQGTDLRDRLARLDNAVDALASEV